MNFIKNFIHLSEKKHHLTNNKKKTAENLLALKICIKMSPNLSSRLVSIRNYLLGTRAEQTKGGPPVCLNYRVDIRFYLDLHYPVGYLSFHSILNVFLAYFSIWNHLVNWTVVNFKFILIVISKNSILDSIYKQNFIFFCFLVEK